MKTKTVSCFIALMSIFVISLVAMNSCSSQAEEEPTRQSRSASPIDVFLMYGDTHNEILDACVNDFVAPTGIFTLTQGVDTVCEFQKRRLQQLSLSPSFKSQCLVVLEESKDILSKVGRDALSYTNDSILITTALIDGIDDLGRTGCLDRNEISLLKTLVNAIEANRQNTLSRANLKNKTDSLLARWESYYANTSFINSSVNSTSNIFIPGSLSGLILGITTKSLEYWDTQLDENDNPIFVDPDSDPDLEMAQWVAADAVGGLKAMIGAALICYASSGEVNWWAVGASGLWGAVDYSTMGGTGKVIKWLTKLHF